jgi:hypothetical protein
MVGPGWAAVGARRMTSLAEEAAPLVMVSR